MEEKGKKTLHEIESEIELLNEKMAGLNQQRQVAILAKKDILQKQLQESLNSRTEQIGQIMWRRHIDLSDDQTRTKTAYYMSLGPAPAAFYEVKNIRLLNKYVFNAPAERDDSKTVELDINGGWFTLVINKMWFESFLNDMKRHDMTSIAHFLPIFEFPLVHTEESR